MNSSRTGLISFLLVTALAATQVGCAVHCYMVQTVPPQKLHVVAATPAAYTIRVVACDEEQIDTPVPPDGRIAFDVPASSRNCTPYLFSVIKVGRSAPVEEPRVIRVMRGERTVRKLSARDIARLPADAEGFHTLRVE